MTKETYEYRKSEMDATHEKERQQLGKEFAFANHPYKQGDLFTDHIGTIRIKSIHFFWSLESPSVYFKGDNLTKSGEISKREPFRTAYQINDINKKKD